MILLCSDGLSSDALRNAVFSRCAAGRTAALVVTADPVYREKNRHVPRCAEELRALNLSVDLFDLDRQPAAELLAYDAVEFIGGNPFYLLHAIRIHQAGSVLRDVAAKGLLIGWSAAAFVFGPTLELVNRYTPEMNDCGVTDFRALALARTEVLPHYSRFIRRFDHFEETCRAYERERHTRVVRLDDGDGVLEDGAQTIILRASTA